MARGSQFLQLRTMVRNEVGRSNQAGGAGIADFNEINQKLNKHYEFLYADFDWPHLRTWFDRIPTNAGQRYYDVPVGVDYERIECAAVWWGGRPNDIDRGIAIDDFRSYSSPDGERAGPILKWDIANTGTKEQIEVWPIPSDSSNQIQFRGIRKFTRLIADADLCLLDDNLVVGFAAAEILAAQGAENAKTVLSAAQAIYDRLKRRTRGAGKAYSFAQTAEDRRPKFIVLAK